MTGSFFFSLFFVFAEMLSNGGKGFYLMMEIGMGRNVGKFRMGFPEFLYVCLLTLYRSWFEAYSNFQQILQEQWFLCFLNFIFFIIPKKLQTFSPNYDWNLNFLFKNRHSKTICSFEPNLIWNLRFPRNFVYFSRICQKLARNLRIFLECGAFLA